MMTIIKRTAILLCGFYLMGPPLTSLGPNGNAPLTQWPISHSYDSAKACEAMLSKLHHDRRATGVMKAWVNLATCVGIDDPRLKKGQSL